MSDNELTPRNPARTEEAIYAERTRERADEIAERLSALLPDGLRFEWGGDTQDE